MGSIDRPTTAPEDRIACAAISERFSLNDDVTQAKFLRESSHLSHDGIVSPSAPLSQQHNNTPTQVFITHYKTNSGFYLSRQ
jgi:hypothetical protein